MAYPKELEQYGITEELFNPENVYILVDNQDGRKDKRDIAVYTKEQWTVTGKAVAQLKKIDKCIYAPEGWKVMLAKDVDKVAKDQRAAVVEQKEAESKEAAKHEEKAKDEAKANKAAAAAKKKADGIAAKKRLKEQSKK